MISIINQLLALRASLYCASAFLDLRASDMRTFVASDDICIRIICMYTYNNNNNNNNNNM